MLDRILVFEIVLHMLDEIEVDQLSIDMHMHFDVHDEIDEVDDELLADLTILLDDEYLVHFNELHECQVHEIIDEVDDEQLLVMMLVVWQIDMIEKIDSIQTFLEQVAGMLDEGDDEHIQQSKQHQNDDVDDDDAECDVLVVELVIKMQHIIEDDDEAEHDEMLEVIDSNE